VQIIHGTKDHLFPFSQSERLKALFPKKIELAPIIGAHHNNLPDYPEYYQTLYDSLNKKLE